MMKSPWIPVLAWLAATAAALLLACAAPDEARVERLYSQAQVQR